MSLLLFAVLLNAAVMDRATESRIAMAKAQIAKDAAQPDGYTSLALALLKASRAADCAGYLQQADQAVAKALHAAPDNFEAHKAEVAVRLAQGRYREALEEARALNKKVPDDNLLYGYLADAEMALGDYTAAEKATQWMINQRPVNAAGFERGARLRDDFGYSEPALEWWNSALRITSSSDVEERAWVLSNMSTVALRMGKTADAVKSARQALELVAGYPLASDALASAMLEQGQAAEAATVLRQRLSVAPDVSAEYVLGKALEQGGQSTEAAAEFAKFEKDALAETSQPDNANRELMEYYASHHRASDAIQLGQKEAQRRQDIFTLATYALALESAGNYAEAKVQMERALSPGIRDAKLFLRAGSIAAKLNDSEAAARYLKKAIEINASSSEASEAIRLLAQLENNSANSRFIHR